MRRTNSVVAAAVAMVVATAPPAFAAPGDLDDSFSGDGKTVSSFNAPDERGEGVAVRADGRILVVGHRQPAGSPYARWAIAQHLPNGTLDPSFGGGDGKVTTGFADGYAEYPDVALLPSGKFVVAGTAESGFAIARYHADGRLDASFHPAGVDGVRTIPIQGTNDQVRSVHLWGTQPVIVGTSYRSGSEGPMQMVVRLTSSGDLDTTFGAPADGGGRTGIALTRVHGYSSGEDAVVLDDGSVVVAGYTMIDPYFSWLVVKYTTAGRRAASFGGGDGWLTTRFSSGPDASSLAHGVAATANGRIIVAGEHDAGGDASNDVAVARYTANGSLDPAFGTGGKATYDAGTSAKATDVAVAQDGKIVVVGGSGGTYLDQLVMRATAGGALDAAFGTGGTRTFDVRAAYEDEEAREVAVRDGKIVIVGTAWDPHNSTRHLITVARLLNS